MRTNIDDLIQGLSGGFHFIVTQGGEHFFPETEPPDLYEVRGLAPTYTNFKIGGVYENLVMNWWVFRKAILKRSICLSFLERLQVLDGEEALFKVDVEIDVLPFDEGVLARAVRGPHHHLEGHDPVADFLMIGKLEHPDLFSLLIEEELL